MVGPTHIPTKAAFTLERKLKASRCDVKKNTYCIPFRNAIFRGIIPTERCCFVQLLKVVHFRIG
jgi:hypothetical protein